MPRVERDRATRRIARLVTVAVLGWALSLPAAGAETATPPAQGKAPAETAAASFMTSTLAGGGINTITVNVPLNRVPEPLDATFSWTHTRNGKEVFSCTGPAGPPITVHELTKAELSKDVEGGGKRPVTVLTMRVPPPDCVLPPWQEASIVIRGKIRQEGGTTVEDTQLLKAEGFNVSVFWFPLTIALLVVGLIYPGCALIAWYIHKRRYDRAPSLDPNDAPDFWKSLDPVQITANPYGRASLSKLQIFGFSLLIFGLMLYYQLRTGILITLSTDILALLGISAVGAAGGKLTALAKRRLSFANWAWLRRNGWLPGRTDDYAPRARWRELITDFDGKEFDVYSFQMAVFSLIVAVALFTTNLAGVEPFHIPAELLGLLGISQGVFIVGRAAGTSAYQELDSALTDLRKKADAYLSLKAGGPSKQTDAEAALKTFRQAAQQAATMFWDVYGPEIGEETRPPALDPGWLENLTPETPPPLPEAHT